MEKEQEVKEIVFTPGHYQNVSNEDYHAANGISKSGLSLFNENPEKYHWRYIAKNHQAPKAIFDIGQAFHTRTLEPELFSSQFILGPPLNKNSNKWKEFVAANTDRIILSQKDWDMVNSMADKVRNHPEGKDYLAQGHAETSVFAAEPETGEMVKIRPDWITGDVGVDLKSCVNASPDKFQRDMYTYGYFVQAGMYPEVFGYLYPGGMNEFVFIAVEKEPPYSIGFYRADLETIALGRDFFYRTLHRFAECKKRDYWPSYNDDRTVDLCLPQWAVRNERNATTADLMG